MDDIYVMSCLSYTYHLKSESVLPTGVWDENVIRGGYEIEIQHSALAWALR